jgi:uncharacterized protein
MNKATKFTSKSIMRILEDHKKELQQLGVKKIGLFGSFLKAQNKKTSDIDFLVTLHNPTFDAYMELKFFLEKLFKRKVDVVMEKNLKPAMKYVKEEAVYAKS